MAKTPAWQRKEGKNPNGGLNAKGRASAKAQGMKGMKSKLTSAKTANDPNSRINKSLKAWNC